MRKRISFLKSNISKKLTSYQLLRFLMFFSLNIENGTIAELMCISRQTISRLVVRLQAIIFTKTHETRQKIGGEPYIAAG